MGQDKELLSETLKVPFQSNCLLKSTLQELRISDLLDNDDHFLSFENFKCKFGVRCAFLDYAGVLAAIPKAWKSEIVGNIAKGDGEPLKTLSNGHDISSTRNALLMLAERSFSLPIVEINLKKTSAECKGCLRTSFQSHR